MLHSQVMENTSWLYKHVATCDLKNLAMLNWLRMLPISYPTRLMGSLPIASFLIDLLHWKVPFYVIYGPPLVTALDGAPNMWLSVVHLYCNDCKNSSSSKHFLPSSCPNVEKVFPILSSFFLPLFSNTW